MCFALKKTTKSKKMNELIEKYFEKSLTSEEQIIFEDKLKNDSEFKTELEFYSELKNAVIISERQSIKKQIKRYESTKNEQNTVFYLRKLLPYAASIAVVIALFMIYYINQINTNEIYTSNFEPYPNIELSNSRSNTKSSLENDAFIAYDLENYELAQSLFSKLLETKSNDYLHFYNGMCAMKLESFEIALAELKMINESNVKYFEKAIWYKALIYLKKNNKKEAKQLLQNLITNYTFKSLEAKKILKQL